MVDSWSVDAIPTLKNRNVVITCSTSACLKIHSRHLHVPLCYIIALNSGYVARSCPSSGTNLPQSVSQLPESNFKTRSSGIGLEVAKVFVKRGKCDIRKVDLL